MYNRVVVHGVQITCLAASSTDSISKNDFFESFCDSLDEVDIDQATCVRHTACLAYH